jgi:hypothetical protein
MEWTKIHIILFANGITVRMLMMLGTKDSGSNIMEVLNTVYRNFVFIKTDIISHFRNPDSSMQ